MARSGMGQTENGFLVSGFGALAAWRAATQVIEADRRRADMEVRMRNPCIDDYVRLVKDIPELGLNRNEIGIVRSTWFAPSIAYEVEFHPVGQHHQTRALLLAEQVCVQDGSLLDEDRAFGTGSDYHATLVG